MTGLFVFVGGAAAFMMGLAISDGLDLEDRIISIVSAVILVPVSAVFGAGLFRSVFADALTRRRWRRMREQLHDLGFRDASEAQFQETRALQVPLLSNATLGPQRGGGIDHLVVGQIGGRHARCFNVRIRGGGWVDTPAVALRIPVSSPTTVVIPLDLKVPPQPRMRRVRFEHQRFNRRVAVYSVDRCFASALIDARMMEWIMADLRGASIQLADRWAVISNLAPRGARHTAPALLGILTGFSEQIPRVLPSLYPGPRSDSTCGHPDRSLWAASDQP